MITEEFLSFERECFILKSASFIDSKEDLAMSKQRMKKLKNITRIFVVALQLQIASSLEKRLETNYNGNLHGRYRLNSLFLSFSLSTTQSLSIQD